MKLHVSACNDHNQVSAPIKKSLYIYVRECSSTLPHTDI